jgi:hypothetical protein
MTEIHTVHYVELNDLLTHNQLDVWSDYDLPWTYGDTTLSCITKEDLMEWLQEGLDDPKPEFGDLGEWEDAIKSVKSLADDVLISL